MATTEGVLEALANQERASDARRVAEATAPLADLISRAIREAEALEAVDRAPLAQHRQVLEDPVWKRRREYNGTLILLRQIADIEALLANAQVIRRLVGKVRAVTAAEIAAYRGTWGWAAGMQGSLERYLSSAVGVAERLEALDAGMAALLQRATSSAVIELGEPAPMAPTPSPAPAFAESSTREAS